MTGPSRGEPVYAITLHQPWASLIALGIKTVETRSWLAPERLLGQTVAIHAGKRVVRRPGEVIERKLRAHWGDDWRLDMPTGAVGGHRHPGRYGPGGVRGPEQRPRGA